MFRTVGKKKPFSASHIKKEKAIVFPAFVKEELKNVQEEKEELTLNIPFSISPSLVGQPLKSISPLLHSPTHHREDVLLGFIERLEARIKEDSMKPLRDVLLEFLSEEKKLRK